MPISNIDDYNRVMSASWYTPPPELRRPEEITYPCHFPFSQMYPLICFDIRSFLSQMYLFSDDHFRNTTLIDETLQNSLDQLLSEKVCGTLVERLSSQYPGQIVQILTNLDHFEMACKDLERLLVEARSSSSAAGPITLRATSQFAVAKKRAETRIFELVNSKIDDLIETAEYDWTSTQVPTESSEYLQELTRYLSNIMSSVLMGLPETVKKQIYHEALGHTSAALLALPLDPSVTKISPQVVTAYKMDVDELISFVDSLPDATTLRTALAELRQTTDLMTLLAAGNAEEFFDSSRSGARFSQVDKIKGAELLEKVLAQQDQVLPKPERLSVLPEAELVKKPSTHFGDFRDRLGQFTKRS
jgi:hypothetical protein